MLIVEIAIYGVVTEICVVYAARGLTQRGYRLTLVSDAVQHLEESKANTFLDEFVNSGGSLVTTRNLVKRLSIQ